MRSTEDAERANAVPVFGMFKNKELLEPVVTLVPENLGFRFMQEECFSDLSFMLCARHDIMSSKWTNVTSGRSYGSLSNPLYTTLFPNPVGRISKTSIFSIKSV